MQSIMNIVLKVLLLISYVSVDCRPDSPLGAKIGHYDFDLDEPGHFSYSVATSDGFRHDVNGHLDKHDSLVIQGSYSYTAPNGVIYTITYVADRNGFQPSVQHTPELEITTSDIPPQIIPEVLRSGCIASLCGTGLG